MAINRPVDKTGMITSVDSNPPKPESGAFADIMTVASLVMLLFPLLSGDLVCLGILGAALTFGIAYELRSGVPW
jgi:hypothetical protein